MQSLCTKIIKDKSLRLILTPTDRPVTLNARLDVKLNTVNKNIYYV